MPDLFPKTPQTTEEFSRPIAVGIEKQYAIVDLQAQRHSDQLRKLFLDLEKLNKSIVSKELRTATAQLQIFVENYGCSHLLLRKATLIKVLSNTEDCGFINTFLSSSGLENSSVIATSLLHCYTEEFDHLSIKRSIMNLASKGAANRFTRDICRTPFHPFAKDSDELSEMLQSALQSSLIDAIVLAKVNQHLLHKFATTSLNECFDLLTNAAPQLDDIAKLYAAENDDEGEHIFYKHSSAWLECSDVVRYRALQDTFYDQPEAEYISTAEPILHVIREWVSDVSICNLSSSLELTRHSSPFLRQLENQGTATRSSIFNYLVHQAEGYLELDDAPLLALMTRTRDLAKTINPVFLSRFARLSKTRLSKLILYLLIAKKSKNEQDDHYLRRVFQEIVIQDYHGNMVSLFEALNEISKVVATYAYEVCTEDFIAKLYHLVESPAEITESRANLHKWMGGVTGEQIYLDRARTILIDHQLNKIRGEIDDNRIYVDVGRFLEWFNDEAVGELNVTLAGILQRSDTSPEGASQIISFVERCYSHFCSNKIFGIASYLGRRIRHGTFKGHLYSSVISIERQDKYKELFADPLFFAKWSRWKEDYEIRINDIIRDRLHIESSTKKDALIRPTQNHAAKFETLSACARAIVRDFADTGSTLGSGIVAAEYCWRLAEIDLKFVNAFLKNQKAELTNAGLLNEMKACVYDCPRSKEFSRELTRAIDEKLMAMYNWFKRPVNVSPKASVSLLYKAVVSEVKVSFPDFDTATEYAECDDIELMGGAYHVLYDSLYVVVYNAAKHGKGGAQIRRDFSVREKSENAKKSLGVALMSPINDCDDESQVNERLTVKPDDDISNAQLSEVRSGLRKLHHLQQIDKNFKIEFIGCEGRQVKVKYSYTLEH